MRSWKRGSSTPMVRRNRPDDPRAQRDPARSALNVISSCPAGGEKSPGRSQHCRATLNSPTPPIWPLSLARCQIRSVYGCGPCIERSRPVPPGHRRQAVLAPPKHTRLRRGRTASDRIVIPSLRGSGAISSHPDLVAGVSARSWLALPRLSSRHGIAVECDASMPSAGYVCPCHAAPVHVRDQTP
jgi:hypothetical protein